MLIYAMENMYTAYCIHLVRMLASSCGRRISHAKLFRHWCSLICRHSLARQSIVVTVTVVSFLACCQLKMKICSSAVNGLKQ